MKYYNKVEFMQIEAEAPPKSLQHVLYIIIQTQFVVKRPFTVVCPRLLITIRSDEVNEVACQKCVSQ